MLLALPILIPLGTAIALHLLPQRSRLLRVIAFLGALLILGAAVAILVGARADGILVLQIGSWPAPYGITLVADLFSALMVVMVGVIGVAVTGSSFAGVDPRREAFGYHPLIHVLLMGVSGAFLTGDIFNLYVWFEVMLLSSMPRSRTWLSTCWRRRSSSRRSGCCMARPARSTSQTSPARGPNDGRPGWTPRCRCCF
jgi:multicomponent Na+:H+ antiporter subunit D